MSQANIKIEHVPAKDLKAAEYNPRKATEQQYKDLKASITRYGLVNPIVVNSAPKRKNVVIGGHFRLKVAQDMGMETVPVVYVSIEDIKREQELNLRLNKNTGEFDLDLLANIDMDILSDVGFDTEEMDKIFISQNFEDDFNGTEEYDKVAKCRMKEGDLRELGNGKHRLMCGDSTNADHVKFLMQAGQGAVADMVFMDPPYNVNYSGEGKRTKTTIMNDKMDVEKFLVFAEEFTARMKESLKRGGVFYICSGWSSYPAFLYALRKHGLYYSGPIIWVKDNAAMGWNDYRYKHEMILKGNNRHAKAQPVLYGWNGGRHYFAGDRDEADVWWMKRRSSNTMVHPTQKPVAMVTKAIANSSKRGEIVLDLFGGSGTTLIAAEQSARRAFIVEKDPKFCEVILRRWENMKK